MIDCLEFLEQINFKANYISSRNKRAINFPIIITKYCFYCLESIVMSAGDYVNIFDSFSTMRILFYIILIRYMYQLK